MSTERDKTETKRIADHFGQLITDIEKIRENAKDNTILRLAITGFTKDETKEYLRTIKEFNCLGMQYLKP